MLYPIHSSSCPLSFSSCPRHDFQCRCGEASAWLLPARQHRCTRVDTSLLYPYAVPCTQPASCVQHSPMPLRAVISRDAVAVAASAIRAFIMAVAHNNQRTLPLSQRGQFDCCGARTFGTAAVLSWSRKYGRRQWSCAQQTGFDSAEEDDSVFNSDVLRRQYGQRKRSAKACGFDERKAAGR